MNISIWKGTTMEKTKRKYSALEYQVRTRVMNQAHMEQQIRISAAESTVITRLFQKAAGKPWASMALR